MEGLTPINSMEDLRKATSHPYRHAEYLTDQTQIFEVSEDPYENEALLESYEGEENALWYGVNWEDHDMYTEDGTRIEAVYCG